MTLFNINGEWLDVKEDTSVQIVRKNEIFAFDELEVERTSSIELPATPTNLRLFNLSNDYHTDGAYMRRRVDNVQMVLGTVTYMGVLYLTGYDYTKKEFTAVYLYGSLLGLKALKDAGTLLEIGTQHPDWVDWDSTVYTAENGVNAIFKRIRYAGDPENAAMSIGRLIDNIRVQLPHAPTIENERILQRLFVVKAEMNGFVRDLPLSMTVNPQGGSQPSSTVPLNAYNQIADPDYNILDVVAETFGLYTSLNGVATQLYWTWAGWQALTAVTIKLPFDLGADWFLMKNDGVGVQANYYGDYWFSDINTPGSRPIIYGTPLAGKEITLAAGDKMFLVNVEDYRYASASGLVRYGWMFEQGHTLPCVFGNMQVQGDERFFYADNLPEITALDLCKTVAALLGKVLRYNESINSITFEEVDWSGWSTYSIDGKVMERKVMERTFKDYAQRNEIKTEDGAVMCEYDVDNDYLQPQRDLYIIPLDGGSVGVRDNMPALIIGENDTLAQAVAGNDNLEQIVLERNAGLYNLVYNSTRLKVKCRLNALEVYMITAETVILFDGCKWVWVSMQWQDDTAEIELQKIGAQNVQTLIG